MAVNVKWVGRTLNFAKVQFVRDGANLFLAPCFKTLKACPISQPYRTFPDGIGRDNTARYDDIFMVTKI